MDDHYALPVTEVLGLLDSSPAGLSRAEVKQRQQHYGLNRFHRQPPVPAWHILLRQFSGGIIYLLLFAVLFSLLLGEWTDAAVILAILIMNGMIGFVQELKANRSLEALRKMARIRTTVIREGLQERVDSEQLVPGDVICLESGDKIPADGRLLSVTRLEIEESVLTGESQAVDKCAETLSDSLPLADRRNMIFSTASVVSGRGVAVVTATGMETEVGRISEMIAAAALESTPLQRRLDVFGRKLGMVITAVCLFVFFLLLGRKLLAGQQLDMRVFIDFSFVVISLAVAAVPTALPAVVTIALSIGTRTLLKKKMLVRRLTSVETLGSCDVICSDKTGTLTRNQMTVRSGWTLSGEFSISQAATNATSSLAVRLLFEIGSACNNAGYSCRGDGDQAEGSPTECALLNSAKEAGVTFTGERLEELPFDTSRKCMSVLVRTGSEVLVYTKGAPDHLLRRCSRVLQADGRVVPLTGNEQKRIAGAIDHFAGLSMRVIACGFGQPADGETLIESELVFVGLQAMIDPPRADVARSIDRARAACIRSIMITGDHRETARAIGEQVGIRGGVLTGSELDAMDDATLTSALETTDIFARVVPQHKLRIVSLLQEGGHVVAMTGDGVNDAPALKKADIGIAVGSGTEVAKEAADFVVLDDSFTSIVDAVEEGRGIYDNIQKSIMLLLSGNLMEVLLVLLAVLFGWNLPLTALLLLWINLITDGAPALAYTVDPYGARIMRRPPIDKFAPILSGNHLRLLLFLGMAGALLGLWCFQAAGGIDGTGTELETARTVAFSYVVLFEMVLVFVIRSSYRVPLRSNPWLWTAVGLSLLLQGVILYTPVNGLFKVTPLGAGELLLLGQAGFGFGACCLLALLWVRRQAEQGGG